MVFVPSVSSSRDEWKNFLCTIRRKKTFTLQKKPKKWVVWSWQAFFNTSPFLRLAVKKSFFIFQDVPYNRKKLNGLFWRLNVKNGGCVEKYLSKLYYSFFGLFWKCESFFCRIAILSYQFSLSLNHVPKFWSYLNFRLKNKYLKWG